ncbi:hypothetical protein [Acinetobacter pseudolwoffii]|uniref:Uncharacterized protein n=1 Tax=Acinetobacter pseudolwoffii TaxID=2053287 RepID=A0A2H9UMV9_9GAMM|nr:hypothetical protein [Acinetobacter pseudolwoffii]PJI33021.1 hypothetical protein CU320_05065 [Acinetobacter pseudolwoffii]
MKKILATGLICLLYSSYSFALDAVGVISDMGIKRIEFVHPFDAKTDPNKQLGRPNQYIDKASWPDPLIDDKFESDGYYDSGINPTEYKGGTVEKFRNQADLNRRYNYIKSVHLAMPITNEYMFKKGLFILRLNRDFTPQQAKEYEEKFYKVVR